MASIPSAPAYRMLGLGLGRLLGRASPASAPGPAVRSRHTAAAASTARAPLPLEEPAEEDLLRRLREAGL